jgi:hypothetical protein
VVALLPSLAPLPVEAGSQGRGQRPSPHRGGSQSQPSGTRCCWQHDGRRVRPWPLLPLRASPPLPLPLRACQLWLLEAWLLLAGTQSPLPPRQVLLLRARACVAPAPMRPPLPLVPRPGAASRAGPRRLLTLQTRLSLLRRRSRPIFQVPPPPWPRAPGLLARGPRSSYALDGCRGPGPCARPLLGARARCGRCARPLTCRDRATPPPPCLTVVGASTE